MAQNPHYQTILEQARAGKRVDLSDIEPSEYTSIMQLLLADATVTSLNLVGNQVGSEGAKALAEALATNTTLTSLDLDGNSLGPEAAKVLAQALTTNTTLTSLNLNYNNLGPKGTKTLARALTTNTTLASLNLNCNDLGSKGAKALAEALTINTTLTSLVLGYNDLGSEGAKALAEALAINTTLTSLELRARGIPKETLKEIEALLVRNRSIPRPKLSTAALKENIQNIPQELLMIMADYSALSSPSRIEHQVQQEKLLQQQHESAKAPVDRIIALLHSLASKDISEDTNTQPILQKFNESMNDVLKDALLIGYNFTPNDERIIQDTFSNAFPEQKTQKMKAFVKKLENTWAQIKETTVEDKIWNSTEKILRFTQQLTDRLEQQNEINVEQEIRALKEKSDNILRYNQETGFLYFRKSDTTHIQDKISMLEAEASLIKKAHEKDDLDAIAIQDEIVELKDHPVEGASKLIFGSHKDLEAKNIESTKLKAYETVLKALHTMLKTMSEPLKPTPAQQIRAFIFNLRSELYELQRLAGNLLQNKENEIRLMIENSTQAISQTITQQNYSFSPAEVRAINQDLNELAKILPEPSTLLDGLRAKIMAIVDQPVVFHGTQYLNTLKEEKDFKKSVEHSPPPSPKRPPNPRSG